jgi:proline iminopeptidase
VVGRVLARVVGALWVLGCVSVGAVEDIVPPTAEVDSSLDRVRIRVAGAERWIHWSRHGDAGQPPLLVLHGSLSDHRALRPLAALEERYHVVLWDQRGNGLSERIPKREYTEASIVEEIDAIAAAAGAEGPLTLVGHSFGAMFTSLYLSRRPERVRQAVLIEPGGLNGEIFARTFDEIVNIDLFDPTANALFWQSEQVGPIDHAAADYRALMLLLDGRQTNYHCDPERPPYWPVWRPGAAVDVYRTGLLGSNAWGSRFDFDFARGARDFPGEVLFIGGSCSALGPEYQQRHNAPLFGRARVEEITHAGHRLVQERPDALLEILRGALEEYRGG